MTGTRTTLCAGDLLSKPLAQTALLVRRDIQRLMNRDTLVAFFAENLKSGQSILLQGRAGQKTPAGQASRTSAVFVTNWTKANLQDTDLSAAIVPGAPGSDIAGVGRTSLVVWNTSGYRLRNTATVVSDRWGNFWWSCQLSRETWLKVQENFAKDPSSFM